MNPSGATADQLAGQLLLGRIREPFVVHVGEPFGLGPGGGGDVAAAVAERRRHRPAAHRVQVPAPGRVLHPDSLATNDDRDSGDPNSRGSTRVWLLSINSGT